MLDTWGELQLATHRLSRSRARQRAHILARQNNVIVRKEVFVAIYCARHFRSFAHVPVNVAIVIVVMTSAAVCNLNAVSSSNPTPIENVSRSGAQRRCVSTMQIQPQVDNCFLIALQDHPARTTRKKNLSPYPKSFFIALPP